MNYLWEAVFMADGQGIPNVRDCGREVRPVSCGEGLQRLYGSIAYVPEPGCV